MSQRYDVFLSYCHDDSEIARTLQEELVQAQLTCFRLGKGSRLDIRFR